MEYDEACITSLGLGLGMRGGLVPKKEKQKIPCLNLSFELCPKGEEAIHLDQRHHDNNNNNKPKGFCLEHPIDKSPGSSNNSNNGSRKKLKLTKEQSATLEDIFKLHSTLSPALKQALAEKLNLKHRQVEVWFQNRRARTKLKQTEVDCEFLKKCCEKLTDENLRLKKELQELRAENIGPTPLYIQLSKATTLTICSSCEKLLKLNDGNNNKGNISHVVRNSSQKLKNNIELGGI